MLNSKDTNYKFLNDKVYIRCIKECNYSVISLIKEVYFNPEHPENMNMYISYLSSGLMHLYQDNKWETVHRNKYINDIYEENEIQLDVWYDENKDKYPQIVKPYQSYLQNKEHPGTLDFLKKEMVFVLYNSRNIVKNNRKKIEKQNLIK